MNVAASSQQADDSLQTPDSLFVFCLRKLGPIRPHRDPPRPSKILFLPEPAFSSNAVLERSNTIKYVHMRPARLATACVRQVGSDCAPATPEFAQPSPYAPVVSIAEEYFLRSNAPKRAQFRPAESAVFPCPTCKNDKSDEAMIIHSSFGEQSSALTALTEMRCPTSHTAQKFNLPRPSATRSSPRNIESFRCEEA